MLRCDTRVFHVDCGNLPDATATPESHKLASLCMCAERNFYTLLSGFGFDSPQLVGPGELIYVRRTRDLNIAGENGKTAIFDTTKKTSVFYNFATVNYCQKLSVASNTFM